MQKLYHFPLVIQQIISLNFTIWNKEIWFFYSGQITGEPLIRRSDDNAETLKKRLSTYHTQTQPLVDYYALQGIHYYINATQSAEKVFKDIDQIFLRVTKQDEKKSFLSRFF